MKPLLLVLSLLLGACQSLPGALPPLPDWQEPEGREHPAMGQILELRSGRLLTPGQLVEELAPAPWVLIGEQHDNADHHALQRWLLQALQQRRAQGALVLEMLDADQQPAVDRLRQRLAAGEPVESLQQALDWRAGWDWQQYGGLLGDALPASYALLAGNLSSGEVRAIYQQVPALPVGAATAAPVQEQLLEQIRQSHCGMLPQTRLPAMLAVQQQRDRRMAQALLAAPQPAALIAGSFHVRRDLGVPLHLADLGAVGTGKVLLLTSADAPVQAAMTDYVWFTPRPPEQDYCAAFGS